MMCHVGSEGRATLESDPSAVVSEHRDGQGFKVRFLFCPHGPESDKRKLAKCETP